jgi:hypothetical protein
MARTKAIIDSMYYALDFMFEGVFYFYFSARIFSKSICKEATIEEFIDYEMNFIILGI